MEPSVELLQFPYSHFNEKARWALDFKQVPHRRHSYLPGPHIPAIRRLTGQTKTPVVRFGDTFVHGTARIIDELETRYAAPPLYPEAPQERERALKLQLWFDEDVGPAVRCALFAEMIGELGYLCRLFAGEKSLVVRALYRGSLPFVRELMRKGNGVTGPDAVAAARVRTREALDFVARESADGGYLVGDRFSVADLTAAALLAPAANPPGVPTISKPEPMPASVKAWHAEWADHPGVAWVHAQFARHRPASAAIS